MFETMKIIHMVCLFGGGAAMIGNGILMAKVMRAGGPPPAIVGETMKNLGMTGLASVVLLWITGGVMTWQMGAAIDLEFALKLIGAAVVLGAVSIISILSARAEKAGTPPPVTTIKKLSRLSQIGVLTAVVFAVLAFN